MNDFESKIQFNQSNYIKFGTQLGFSYPLVGRSKLLPAFPTKYLVEKDFTSMVLLLGKQ